jgi:hypothetical protein
MESSKGVRRRIFEAMFDDSNFEYRIVSDKSGVAAAFFPVLAKQLGLRLLNELHRSGRRR